MVRTKFSFSVRVDDFFPCLQFWVKKKREYLLLSCLPIKYRAVPALLCQEMFKQSLEAALRVCAWSPEDRQRKGLDLAGISLFQPCSAGGSCSTFPGNRPGEGRGSDLKESRGKARERET